MSTWMTRAWRDGKQVGAGFPLAEATEHLETPGTVVWIDLLAPDEATLDAIDDEFKLHHLAVEDAAGPHQRPKLDHYEHHLFLACHALDVSDIGELTINEIDAFIGPNWFITVRKTDGFSAAGLLRRWEQSPDLLCHGVPYLLYGLLDMVIDQYFDAVNQFDEYYDEVSEGLFADEPLGPDQQRQWFEARRSLVQFHRLVVPMREVVSSLMRREHTTLDETMYPYFQDVYDHILRVTESADGLRDLVATIVETNLSLRDYRQNQVMKKVTSWAAIVAVPTLVTGFYGMNVPYPGFARHWGVWVSTGIMVVVSLWLYASFRRRDWL